MAKPKKKPWLAGLLSLLVAGMGQVYNREYGKGIFLLILEIIDSVLILTDYWIGISLGFPILIYAVYDAYTTAKRTIHREPYGNAKWITATICVVFVLIVMLSGMAYMYISGIYAGGVARTQELSETADTYVYYRSLVRNDTNSMTGLYNNWVGAYNDAVEDGQLTDAEVLEMGNAINEYTYEYRIVKSHLARYRYFIRDKESDLEELEVDTVQVEIDLGDTDIRLQNDVDRMRAYTENLVTAHAQYQQQLTEYLQLLLALM